MGAMAKPSKKLKVENIETEPGVEERFERTVRRMLNTPPKPRKRPKGKGNKNRDNKE